MSDSMLVKQSATRNRIRLASGEVLPLEEVFLLNPHHREFVIGKAGYIQGENYYRLMPWLVLFLLVGLGFFFSGWWGRRGDNRLAREGVRTMGEVVSLYFDDTENLHSHYITYVFSPPNSAKSYQREQFVSPETFAAAQVGQAIAVLYVPDKPHLSELVGDGAENHGNVIQLRAGLFISGLMLALILPLGARLARHQMLIRRGMLLKGEVIRSRQTQQSGRFFVHLQTRFRSPRSNQEIQSSWNSLYGELRADELPTTGTGVVFLYVNDQVYQLL